MTFYKKLNPIIKLTLAIALSLFIYGILSRQIPVYFFWESLTLSWFVFLIGLILILVSGIKKKVLEKKSTFGLKIGIGITCFIITVQIILFVSFQNSEAFKITKEYLIINNDVIKEIGEIKEFSLLPTGQIKTKINLNGKSGTATLNLIVKGEKGFKKLTVNTKKDFDSEWEVIGIK